VKVTQIRQHCSPDVKRNGAGPIVKEEIIRTLTVGDYFGEQALLLGLNENDLTFTNEASAIRTANVISEECECLVLDQVHFFNLLGDLNEIRLVSLI